jgi:hypothetical protein
MSAHGSGVTGIRRPVDDGTKRTPTWNVPLTKPPLNQGAQFQQEIIDHRLRSEQSIAAYMKGRPNERR